MYYLPNKKTKKQKKTELLFVLCMCLHCYYNSKFIKHYNLEIKCPLMPTNEVIRLYYIIDIFLLIVLNYADLSYKLRILIFITNF